MLFTTDVISRGVYYYHNRKVYNCIKNGNTYTGYVKGSSGNDYSVTITTNKHDDIEIMKCTCPYENNCKHEYATIMYIRDKFH